MKNITAVTAPIRILIHLIGWIAYYGLTVSRNQTSEFEGNIYLAAASFLALYIPLFYTVWYIVSYCAAKRAWQFCFLLLLLFYPTLVSLTYLVIYKLFPLYDVVFYNSEYRLTWTDLFGTLIVEYCKLLIHVFLFRLILWGIRSISPLPQQKSENSALKEQQLRFVLDGHFQYNVLSSIANQLALRGNWEFARSLGRLGSVQRYSYEKTQARQTMINLREELNQVESLVDVLRLQYGRTNVVEYVKKGSVEEHQVPSVLLLSFMDNILKYASVNPSGRAIKIKIDCQEEQFTFCAINKYDDQRRSRPGSGIGLSNVKERLELLAPQRYHLRYGKRLGYFYVELIVKQALN